MPQTWVDFYNTLMANAKSNSLQRSQYASDPNFGIHYSTDSGDKSFSGHAGSDKSVMDRLWNDDMSIGKRAIDVLSRGNYASANAFKSYFEQGQADSEGHHNDVFH